MSFEGCKGNFFVIFDDFRNYRFFCLETSTKMEGKAEFRISDRRFF
jgi:hypothetical protein